MSNPPTIPPHPSVDNFTVMPPPELTLIVAATSKMGIGIAGGLPWKGLKKEMAYFARVTKRAPSNSTNTVIMGRKTWESIPPRFRPLKDRSNIVISRSISQNSVTGGIHASSIEDAVKSIPKGSGEKVFVIGGAQIYREALQKVQAKRILLTRVLSEFECDTFFPITLGEDGKAQGWVRRSQKELDDWVGESVAEGILVEEGTAYVFEMWERSEDPN